MALSRKISKTETTNVTNDAVIYSSPDVTGYIWHEIHNVSALGSFTVQTSVDGVNWTGDITVRKRTDETDSATVPGASLCYIVGSFHFIRVLNYSDRLAGTATLVVAHGGG